MEILLIPLVLFMLVAAGTILVLVVRLAAANKRAEVAEKEASPQLQEELLRMEEQLGFAHQRADQAEEKANQRLATAISRTRDQLKAAEKRIRADAIKKSTAVVKGKVAEHFVPFVDVFPFNPRDCRFLGSPVDLVVFEGLAEGNVTRVVFIEVKSGKYARLSQREKQVRNAIENGEVDYEVIKL